MPAETSEAPSFVNVLEDPEYWNRDELVFTVKALRRYYGFWFCVGAALAFLATFFWPAGLFYEIFFGCIVVGAWKYG